MKNGLLVLAATAGALIASGCKPADESDAEACLRVTPGAERGAKCLPICVAATSPRGISGACGGVQLEVGACADAWKEAHPGGKSADPAQVKNTEWPQKRDACRALCTSIAAAKLSAERLPVTSHKECDALLATAD